MVVSNRHQSPTSQSKITIFFFFKDKIYAFYLFIYELVLSTQKYTITHNIFD